MFALRDLLPVLDATRIFSLGLSNGTLAWLSLPPSRCSWSTDWLSKRLHLKTQINCLGIFLSFLGDPFTGRPRTRLHKLKRPALIVDLLDDGHVKGFPNWRSVHGHDIVRCNI